MRIYFCISFFTLLACLFLSSEAGCPVNQVFDPTSNMCRDNCPTYYYEVTQSSLQICISQTQVKNILRPTLEPFTFLLIFDNVNYTIIQDTTDLWTVLTFSLDSSSSVTPLTSSDLTLTFLDLDKTILQIDLTYQSWMKYPATLVIDFKDLSTTQTNNYYFKSEQLSISLLPFDTLSSTQENFLNVLKKMNFGLEIAWTAVSLLNYYPVAYLQGKQYREMFNLYKITGVTYSPIALEFFRETNEKIAGVKVPNLFSILLYDQDFSSGWDADMNKRVLLQNDPTRDDYKLILNERFMEFNSSPLFLENLGIEIILVAGLLIGVVVTEILAFLFFNDEEAETIFYTFFMFIRVLLRWNFLFATLIGALPSLMYFAMAQIQSFALYGTLGHNLAGGIVSIVVILAMGIIFPLIVFEKIRLVFRIKEKTLEIINYNEVMTLDFFGIFHEYFKIDSIFYPMFILVFMIRSMLVSAICLFLTNKPIAQAILMLIMSIVILAALILFKPYAKKHYNVFQIGLETINLIMLLIMLISASSSKTKLLDSGFIGTLNVIMVLLWVFTPLWVTGFGVYVIAIKFRRTKVQKPPATFRSRKISIRASMRASVRIHPLKTGMQPRVQLERRPERPRMFETFKFEQNSASSPQNTMDNLSPTRSPNRWLSDSPTQPSFRSIGNATQRSQIKSRTQIVPDSSSSNSNSPLMSGSHSRIMIRSNTNISKDPIEAIELKQSKLPPGIPIQLAAIKAGEVENLETKKEEDEQLFELNSRRELITITKI